MSDANQNNEIVTYLCTHAFQTEALLKAQSVILNSLMKVVCENLGENLKYETCIDDITVGKSYDVISKHQDYIIRDSLITDYVTLYNLRNDKGNINGKDK